MWISASVDQHGQINEIKVNARHIRRPITRARQIPLNFFKLLLDFGWNTSDFSSGLVDTEGITRQELGLIITFFCLS